MEGKIYGIVCPIDNTVRYVGQTIRTLQLRLMSHLYRARICKDCSYKDNWLNKIRLLNKQKDIKMVLLDTGSTDDELNKKEILWIEYYRKSDVKLTNLLAGGNVGREWIEAYRTKIIGKRKHSEETKLKISMSRMGENNPNYGKNRYKLKESHRLGLSQAIKNSPAFIKVKSDPNYVAKIKKTLSKPVYLLSLENQIIKEFSSCRDLAKEFKVTYSCIKNARRFGAKFKTKYRIVYKKDYENQILQISKDIPSTVE